MRKQLTRWNVHEISSDNGHYMNFWAIEYFVCVNLLLQHIPKAESSKVINYIKFLHHCQEAITVTSRAKCMLFLHHVSFVSPNLSHGLLY